MKAPSYKNKMSTLIKKLRKGFTGNDINGHSSALTDLDTLSDLVNEIEQGAAMYGDKAKIKNLIRGLVAISKDKSGNFYTKDEQSKIVDSHEKELDKATPHLLHVPYG